MNWWNTTVIAVVGATTGILSLLLQGITYLLSRPRLNCSLNPQKDSYWMSGKTASVQSDKLELADQFADMDYCVLSLIVSNKTSVPVTLIDVSSPSLVSVEQFLCLAEPVFKTNFRNKSYSVALAGDSKRLELPFRLKGYDSVTFTKIFVVAPITANSVQIPLAVKTPFKEFKFQVSISSGDVVAQEKIW